VLHWAVHVIPAGSADRAKAIELAEKHFTPQVKENARRVAQDLQSLRQRVNAAFPEFGGRIGLRMLSWFRPRKWELYRGRSGNGQHPNGHAVDFTAVNVPPTRHAEVMQWLWDQLQDWPGGLASSRSGNTWRFIHIDKRPTRARWTY
jgi:hypothetical protein